MSNDRTIHVVDDDPEICKALTWLFESVDLPVQTYESGKKFLAEYHPALRGVIILDVRMPAMSGLELLDKLNELKNTLPTIIITGHGDIPMAVRAMKLGAIEFILKPINDQFLLEAINRSLNRLPEEPKETFSEKINLLTQREKVVMELISAGKYNKEIARDLNISISTVEAHRSSIMNKFGAKNLTELIKIYYQIN